MPKYTTTDQESVGHGVKVLVYGRSGMGKTMLCGTAPTPIILSAEAGLLSLSKANQERVFGKGKSKNIDVVVIDSLDDLKGAFDDLSDPSAPYETICLDSITEIGEKVLMNALAQVKDPRQAYGEMFEQMTNTLKLFRDLPGKHVVFVAQQEAREANDATLFGPAMPGKKLGPRVPYVFDEVFHIDIGKLDDGTQYRFLQTQPDLQFDAKDRSGALDPVEEPNLTNIINKIQSK